MVTKTLTTLPLHQISQDDSSTPISDKSSPTKNHGELQIRSSYHQKTPCPLKGAPSTKAAWRHCVCQRTSHLHQNKANLAIVWISQAFSIVILLLLSSTSHYCKKLILFE